MRKKPTHIYQQSKYSIRSKVQIQNQGCQTREGSTLLPTEPLINTDFKEHHKFL